VKRGIPKIQVYSMNEHRNSVYIHGSEKKNGSYENILIHFENGILYFKTYIELREDQIQDLFEEGVSRQGLKMVLKVIEGNPKLSKVCFSICLKIF